MEVVPVHPKVEIEYIPADSLPRVRHNGGRVTDKRTAVEAVGRKVIATTFKNAVLAGTVVYPHDLPTDTNRHARRIEGKVHDVDWRDACWATRLHGYRPAHHRPVDTAYVVVSCGDRKHGRVVRHTRVERRALEHRSSAEAAHLMEKQRHM